MMDDVPTIPSHLPSNWEGNGSPLEGASEMLVCHPKRTEGRSGTEVAAPNTNMDVIKERKGQGTRTEQ